MNSQELVRTLRAERVPDALYDIPGVHDIPMQPDAYYFLRPESDGWVVGLRERSRDSDMVWYSTEDEACRVLHDKLTAMPSPPPGGDERIREVLAHTDEIQRQAWQDFEHALGEQRRRPGEEP